MSAAIRSAERPWGASSTAPSGDSGLCSGSGVAGMARANFPQSWRRVPRLARVLPREGTKMTTFIKMLKDESGASAAEYALILAIIGTGIAIAAILLGGAIGNSMNSAANCINNPNSTTC